MEGIVKWFNRTKGYGFIAGDDGKEYFVHHTAIGSGTFLRDNDKVSFSPVDSDRGPQAQKVSLLEKGSERQSSSEDEQGEEEEPVSETAEEEAEQDDQEQEVESEDEEDKD